MKEKERAVLVSKKPHSKNKRERKREEYSQAVTETQAMATTELEKILANKPKMNFMKAVIFFVDKVTAERIGMLMSEVGTLMKDYGYGKSSEFVAGGIANIVNPNNPAYRYSLYERKTPTIFTDPAKVYKKMERQVAVWGNIRLAEIKKSFEDTDFSESEKEKMLDEVNEEIEGQRRRIAQIKENFNDYEVILTNYENSPYYPTIYFTDMGGRKQNKHLSIIKPNIFIYSEDKARSRTRSDSSIMDFMQEAEKIGGTVYVKRKLSRELGKNNLIDWG